MAIPEMSLQADWSYYDYLPQFSSYHSEFSRQKEPIEAGIQVYNDNRTKAEGDDISEKAFLQERADAEAFLANKPKDYVGMRKRVGTWAKLLPAINSFAAARRDFLAREPGDDAAAETKAKTEFEKITVQIPATAGVYLGGEQKIAKLGAALDRGLTNRATDKLKAIPDLYQKSPLIAQLIADTQAGEQQKQAKAHKEILAWSGAFAGFAEAKKTLDEFAGGKNMHASATAVLAPLAPTLPGPMTSPQSEQDLIATVKALKDALPDGKAYTDARQKAFTAWTQAKPKPLEAAYGEATGAFKTVDEMKQKTVLLAAIVGKVKEATLYTDALGKLASEGAKIERVEPEASSPEGKNFAVALKQARDAATVLATGGRFVEATQKVGEAQTLVQNRQREVKDARAKTASEAAAQFDPKDPQIAPAALAVLGTLHAAGSKTGADALLDNASPHLKLAELAAPARRYTRALDDAKANWAALQPTPLTATYNAAITLPSGMKADAIPVSFFDDKIKALTAFNKLWQDSKTFTAQAALVQESFDTLEALYKASKQSGDGRAFLGPVSEARKQLGKLRQDTQSRKFDIAGLAKLGDEIDRLLKQFSGVARDGAAKLVANDPGSKALLAAIDKLADKTGNDAVASLYMAFGDKLPGLLRGLGSGGGDGEQAKAITTLKTLVEKLGARQLRLLTVGTSDDNPVAAGKLLSDVMNDGLAGAGPDPSRNADRLLAEFPDTADLTRLLNQLAAGKPDQAANRLAEVLSTYLGQDIAKLKTPFFFNLKKLSVNALPGMLVEAEKFKQTPVTDQQLQIDKASINNLECPTERMKHMLNRHTYECCAFKGENFQNAATFWPPGTTVDQLQSYLADAVKKIEPPLPALDALWSFVQRDVVIDAGGRRIEVRIGFERYATGANDEYKVKITQFFPKSGNGLTELSTLQMKFIGRGLYGK